MTVVIVGMVLGGVGAAVYFHTSGRQIPPDPAPLPGAEGSPEALARTVVDRLNAKDLTGVIDLTCTQGKNTGRRELIAALPPLDPAAPPGTRSTPVEVTLNSVTPFADGYVAAIRIRYQGATGDGKMRIQRGGDQWTLCGLDPPRFGGAG
ncbi:hypothetical protein EV192_110117 [Actinocrispum wychmicini]|uniref:Lumazine-binding protein n=1 Tax=Actinocrispum wychmicini TaxID=1213861 RepID=A0A4R2JA63_9PSEU|nr:hypothetical protein EV192_110117 [Actinocrispum wychmicini]